MVLVHSFAAHFTHGSQLSLLIAPFEQIHSAIRRLLKTQIILDLVSVRWRFTSHELEECSPNGCTNEFDERSPRIALFPFSPLLQISNHFHPPTTCLSSQVYMFRWLSVRLWVGAMANGIENRGVLRRLQRQNLRSLDGHRAYYNHYVDSAHHGRKTIPLLDQIYGEAFNQEHENEEE
jgi:hypothetical protein